MKLLPETNTKKTCHLQMNFFQVLKRQIVYTLSSVSVFTMAKTNGTGPSPLIKDIVG